MKARFIHVHREVNVGKLDSLTSLYGVYRTYLQACIDLLLEKRCTKMQRSQFLRFFPGHPDLTVHLRRGAEAHTLSIVSSWFSLKYSTVIKKRVSRLKRGGELSEERAKSLFTIGKTHLSSPWKFVTQEDIDLYWSWMVDEAIVGRRPCAPSRPTIVISWDSAKFKQSSDTKLTTWWLSDTHHLEVKGIVRRRYAARRRSPAFSLSEEPSQNGPESRTEVRYSILDSNSSLKE